MNLLKLRPMIFLWILISLALFSCQAKKGQPLLSEDSERENSTDSIEDPVELVIQMVGDAPRDMGMIESRLNDLALDELNCTVSFQYTSWSDYMQRYHLIISSGQPVDLIFTSDWLYYSQLAQKGAFMELDELIPEYAPDLLDFIPREYWDAVRVKGNIYTIPSTWKEYVNEGVIYREDLRQKYGLPLPDSLENIEAYFSGIHAAEASQNLTSSMVIDSGYGPNFSAFSVLEIKYPFVDLQMPYGLNAYYDNPDELFCYWESEDFIQDMKMFKRWAGKGFWSKSSLSNKNPLQDSFINEFSVGILYGQNPMKYNTITSLMKSIDPSIEIGFYPYGRSSGLVTSVHPNHNGMAVPLHAKNPERALMFYQKLLLDKQWNQLSQYGIEGRHYRVDDQGYYEMLGDSYSNGFPREAMNGWAWRNPDYMLFDRNFSRILELFEEFDQYAQPDIFSGFVEDYSEYQAERSALYQIQSQYLLPIQAGLVEDVESAVDDFLERAYAAGLEKIHREYRKQWTAYCQERGLD